MTWSHPEGMEFALADLFRRLKLANAERRLQALIERLSAAKVRQASAPCAISAAAPSQADAAPRLG